MARVLLSFPAEKIENKWCYYSFYQGIIASLKRAGNDVFFMIANEFIANYSERLNSIPRSLDINKLENKIKEINPDLVISFNNFCYKKLADILNCPFIVWGVDSVPFFSDKEKLKENLSRYIICGNNNGDIPQIKDCFKLKDVPVLRFATDIQAQAIKQDFSISFIGYYWDNILKRLLEQEKITSEQNEFLIQHINDKELMVYLEKNGLSTFLKKTDVLHSISSTDRERVLLGLVDLELKLYGQRWQFAQYDLSRRFIKKTIYDIQDVAHIFNRSRINFNMSHFQATDEGFSFRLLDIMASNGCLVTDYKPGYDRLFGKYVKLPTYEYGNATDARKVCEYLLAHEDERLDIVKGSQRAIEAEYRFESRFKQITDLTGVSLIGKKTGSITQIHASDFMLNIANEKEIKTVAVPVKKKKSLWKKIVETPKRKRTKKFKAIYNKYFLTPLASISESIEALGRLAERADIPAFLNPSCKTYHQFIDEQAYIAKVSKGLPPKKVGEKIRVVFLFQEASYWASVKELYEQLKKDSRFDVFVIAIPVLTIPNLDVLEIKQKHIDFLNENGIKYIDGRTANDSLFDPYILKPDYVFVQIHFDRQRPLPYKTNVMGLYTRVCLIPHAFLLSTNDNSELIYQQNYFKIFVPNETHKEILKKVIYRDDNIEVVGYPRFDLYKNKIEDSNIWKISKNKNPTIKRIIWSPHWWAYGHTQKLADNVFNTWNYFYNMLSVNPNIELIIKPHPNLLNGIVGNGYISQSALDEMIEKISALPNASMYTGGDYIDLFKTADLMVNNSISFLAEWLPSGKPMIFQDTERKFELNEMAEKLMGVYYHVDTLNKLDEILKNILYENKDYMKDGRLKLIKKLNLTACNSSEKVKEILLKNINKGY